VPQVSNKRNGGEASRTVQSVEHPLEKLWMNEELKTSQLQSNPVRHEPDGMMDGIVITSPTPSIATSIVCHSRQEPPLQVDSQHREQFVAEGDTQISGKHDGAQQQSS